MKRPIPLFALLLFPLLSYSLAFCETSFEHFDEHIFIGQSYPSGNVYLRRFTKEEGDEHSSRLQWPRKLQLFALAPSPAPRQPFEVIFAEELRSQLVENRQRSVYIPGAEGMDETHLPCGLGDNKKLDPSFQSLSGDFFHSMLDHCEPNDGVARFTGKDSKYSYLVLGIQGHSLSESKVLERQKRPLTENEKKALEKEKKDFLRESKANDCSTEPAYIDAASEIFEAVIDRKTSIRLSTYDSPGCAGHLASIYILDVLVEGQLKKTYTLSQYRGLM